MTALRLSDAVEIPVVGLGVFRAAPARMARDVFSPGHFPLVVGMIAVVWRGKGAPPPPRRGARPHRAATGPANGG